MISAKTKFFIVGPLLAVTISDANAGCDKFKYWKYPWRQACNQRAIYEAAHKPPPKPSAPAAPPKAASLQVPPAALEALREALKNKGKLDEGNKLWVKPQDVP